MSTTCDTSGPVCQAKALPGSNITLSHGYLDLNTVRILISSFVS